MEKSEASTGVTGGVASENVSASAFVGVPDIRDRQKLIFANIFSVLSIIVALAFAAVSGISDKGLVFLGFSFLILLNYLFFVSSKRVKIYENGVLILAAFSSVLFFSLGGISGYLWFFLFPYAAFFLGGIKRGAFFTLAAVMLALLSFFLSSDNEHEWTNGFEARFCFISIYVSCCVLSLCYEAARQDARDKLIEASMNMNSRSAEHDVLTGLMTGVQIRERAIQEAARYDRFQRPFCFLRCNIDCFGIINEKYGFDCGDSILKSVADKLSSMLRETDLASRWGGSEYLILLTETNAERGISVAERLRKSVEDSVWGWKNKRLNLTLSIGLSLYDPMDGVDGSVAVAEERVSKAGKIGGNRVEGPSIALYTGKNSV